MAYYDIYDSNDNLIASEVWIDDGLGGGPTRPVVVNIRKLLMVIFAFVGFINTFVLPIMLFINKDVFIDDELSIYHKQERTKNTNSPQS